MHCKMDPIKERLLNHRVTQADHYENRGETAMSGTTMNGELGDQEVQYPGGCVLGRT